MFSNFTFQDVLGTFIAFSLFPLVIIFPGYVLGWIFNLFEFRARLLTSRFAISLLLSVSISPIFYYLLTSWFSLNVALIATFLVALAFTILIARERPLFPKNGPWRDLAWIVLGWILLSTLSLVDLQLGDHELYFNVASYDHTTRVSIIDAMTRTGVPPINPSYYPGHYVKLTFLYFFWYILGSVIDSIGGSFVDARVALFASILWCGIALMAMVSFYLRLRIGRDKLEIWRRVFIGLGSLAITGLDILPTLLYMRVGTGVIGDLEHWNEQITAWVGSLLWAPHHVAALVAGFTGIMLVHSAWNKSRMERFIALVFSGVAFASTLGLSVWVTLVFVLFWAVWMLSLYLKRENRALLLPMVLAGMVALLLGGSFLLGLLSGGGNAESSSFPMALTVRSFRMADVFLKNSPLVLKYLVHFVFLPLNYFLELGFFALVAILWVKLNKADIRGNPYYFAEVLLLSASFLIGTFTRSTLIENNDLGWRAWLPGQFILLIWGVDVLNQFFASPQKLPALPPKTKYNLAVLIALGVATTILDVTLLRFGYNFAFGSEGGYAIFSARQAYTAVNQVLPENVIVQYNPSGKINHPSGLYGMRQSAISDRTAYGVPVNEYLAKVAAVSKIFTQTNLQDWGPVDALCEEHFIDVIVVVDSDPLWTSLPLLAEQRAPIYMDEHHSVFACGNYNVSR